MYSVDIVLRNAVRIPEAQVDVRLGSKMEDCINLVRLQASSDIDWIYHLAMEEPKVVSTIEHARIAEG